MIRLLLRDTIETQLGPMIAMASGEGLSLLEFADRPALASEVDELQRRYGYMIEPGRNAVLDQIESELAAYFAGELTVFETPLVLPGNAFQNEVWERLREIPYGQTGAMEGWHALWAARMPAVLSAPPMARTASLSWFRATESSVRMDR